MVNVPREMSYTIIPHPPPKTCMYGIIWEFVLHVLYLIAAQIDFLLWSLFFSALHEHFRQCEQSVPPTDVTAVTLPSRMFVLLLFSCQEDEPLCSMCWDYSDT